MCARLRAGCTRSTTCSKGMSWWCCAPRERSFTRPSSSATLGEPDRSTRSASVLTKKPISPSISAWPRLALGVPIDHVVLAREPGEHGRPAGEQRHVKGGAVPLPQRLERRGQRLVQLHLSDAPAKSCRAGRGWSVGSSSSSGAPASVSRQ